jgi:large subunit ribosomal protein L35
VGARFFVYQQDWCTTVPKLKTHKGSAKRFAFSGSGKALLPKGWKNHKRSVRSRRARAQIGQMLVAKKGDAARIHKLLPYGDPR